METQECNDNSNVVDASENDVKVKESDGNALSMMQMIKNVLKTKAEIVKKKQGSVSIFNEV